MGALGDGFLLSSWRFELGTSCKPRELLELMLRGEGGQCLYLYILIQKFHLLNLHLQLYFIYLMACLIVSG